jgi:hypothetical protein
MFGSSARARKVETVVLMALWDEKDQNSVRHCLLLPRTSKAVNLYFQWTDEGLTQTKEPEQKEQEDTGAMGRTTAAVRSAFKDGEPTRIRNAWALSLLFTVGGSGPLTGASFLKVTDKYSCHQPGLDG